MLSRWDADAAVGDGRTLGRSVAGPRFDRCPGGVVVAAGGAASATFTDVETYGAATGPLRGLTGTTDSRLETVTLVGDSQLIAVAEGYLKQIDLRQRQVAVKVQILNIDLLNDKSIDSSFSAKLGDTFIVSESGRAFMNFGAYRPGNRQGTGLLNNGTQYTSPGEYSAGLSQVQQQKVFDPPLVAKQKEVTNQSSNSGGTTTTTTLVPVLVDGQEAEVQTGTSVITSVSTTDTSNGSTQFEYSRENAGLSLKVKVSKIDDNGFVSLNIDPEISVPELAGESNGVAIFNIVSRSISSGSIRLRDRQTLILTGVIQD